MTISNRLDEEAGSGAVLREQIEELRTILEATEHRPIKYEEAVEVGESLIDFYTVLGEGVA